MEENNNSSDSIKQLWVSSQWLLTSHGILEVVANSISKVPTINGIRTSDMKDNSSQTWEITELLMSQEIKILRCKKLLYTRDTEEQTRDGRLFILIRWHQSQPRESTKNLVFTSWDHSTLSPDYQWRELLNVMVLITWESIDTKPETLDNNSSSIKRARTSTPSNGRTTVWQLKAMVNHPTLDSVVTADQDGGISLDIKTTTSLMNKERSWTLTETKMKRTETSLSGISTTISTSNGMSSMLINIQRNQ